MTVIAFPIRRWVLASLMPLALSACPSTGGNELSGTTSSSAALEQTISYPIQGPGGEPVAAEALGEDLPRVLLALKARLDGIGAAAVEQQLGVRGPDSFPSVMASLDDFAVSRVHLPSGPAQDWQAGGGVVEGLMFLRDPTGRRLDLAFHARGSQQDGLVQLDNLGASVLLSAAPASELFIVPEDRVDEALTAALADYARFYKAVEGKALPGHKLEDWPRGSVPALLVLFFKDALIDGTGVSAQLVDAAGRTQPATLRHKDYGSGWLASLLRADIDPQGGPAQWLEVRLTPPREGAEARVLVRYPVTLAARAARQTSALPRNLAAAP